MKKLIIEIPGRKRVVIDMNKEEYKKLKEKIKQRVKEILKR